MAPVRCFGLVLGLAVTFIPCFNTDGFGQGGAIAFTPSIAIAPTGETMTVTPAVSADRRYVRLSVNPYFNVVNGFSSFTTPLGAVGGGVLGGGLGAGATGGAGGLGGAADGAGAGGVTFNAGMNGVIGPANLDGGMGFPQVVGVNHIVTRKTATRRQKARPARTSTAKQPSIEEPVIKPKSKKPN